jgi:predicted nucleic acid-binding protein
MAAITHLLDTSAILAHFFDEPGADAVDAIWQDRTNKPAICVLSIPELRSRLAAELGDSGEAERVCGLYTDQLTVSVPVDRAAAELAADLRAATSSRLPLVDACIAACAALRDAILVHADPHMDPLPADRVRQIRLSQH